MINIFDPLGLDSFKHLAEGLQKASNAEDERQRRLPALYEWPDLPKPKVITEQNTIIYGIKDIGLCRVLDILDKQYLRAAYREELKNVMEVETEINNLIAPINEI
jgi:hypothetical protein